MPRTWLTRDLMTVRNVSPNLDGNDVVSFSPYTLCLLSKIINSTVFKVGVISLKELKTVRKMHMKLSKQWCPGCHRLMVIHKILNENVILSICKNCNRRAKDVSTARAEEEGNEKQFWPAWISEALHLVRFHRPGFWLTFLATSKGTVVLFPGNSLQSQLF